MPLKGMKLTDPSTSRTHGGAGMNLIVLGLLCFVVGLALDGGFVRGLFIGATVALMVMGAYVVGASRKRGHRSEDGPHEGGHWLPSREDSSDRADC